MIADLPQKILIALIATSLLAAVVGFIIAKIMARRRTNAIVRKMEAKLSSIRTDAEVQIRLISDENEELKLSLEEANERMESAIKQEESVDVHAQLLAQKVQSLEEQVDSYEEQQIRLQRDFATYKLNKTRELELAQAKPESWSQSENLPLLNKRIQSGQTRPYSPSQPSGDALYTDSAGYPGTRGSPLAGAASSDLTLPLSKELDIPSLAESELPDSVEELEFELAELYTSGES